MYYTFYSKIKSDFENSHITLECFLCSAHLCYLLYYRNTVLLKRNIPWGWGWDCHLGVPSKNMWHRFHFNSKSKSILNILHIHSSSAIKIYILAEYVDFPLSLLLIALQFRDVFVEIQRFWVGQRPLVRDFFPTNHFTHSNFNFLATESVLKLQE